MVINENEVTTIRLKNNDGISKNRNSSALDKYFINLHCLSV